MENFVDEAIRRFTSLPRPGTPAAELTERDKIALAIAAGVPYRVELKGTKLTITVDHLGVADRGDGGYIVATRTGGR